MNMSRFCLMLAMSCLVSFLHAGERSLDRTGTQWTPYLQWDLTTPGHTGNPYDLEAAVTFTHAESGEVRTTGTRPGAWTFVTKCRAEQLDNHRGTVTIRPNQDACRFVTSSTNRWVRWNGSRGESGFRPEWLDGLDRKDVIEPILQRLLQGDDSPTDSV